MATKSSGWKRARAAAQKHVEIASELRNRETDLVRLARLGIVPISEAERLAPGVLVRVHLPAGWRMEPDAHDHRATNVLDPAGNIRAQSWLKSTAYDMAGSLYVYRRFDINPDFRVTAAHRADDTLPPQLVYDGRARWPRRVVVARFEATESENAKWAAARAQHHRQPTALSYQAVEDIEQLPTMRAVAWLREHYPDCDDVAAYWDLDVPAIEEFEVSR